MFALTVADDLTGAAEVAAALARSMGSPRRVVLGRRALRGGDVAVLPTRRSKPERACRAAAGLALPERGITFVKIDSTLRGPWVELVDTLATRLRAQPLIAPAFPARGRTVAGGIALVDGAPLFAGPFAREILGAEEELSLAGLIARRAPALRAEVPDAVTDRDLDAVAREMLSAGRRLVVGSAGLAEAFARVLGRSTGYVPLAAAPPAHGPVAVAAGSRAAATARQVALLGEHAAVLRGRGLRVLARAALEAAADGTLVACGGETALQILYALRVRGMTVYGEIAPAVVLARPLGSDLTLLTKSGSLGADDALLAALEALDLANRRT